MKTNVTIIGYGNMGKAIGAALSGKAVVHSADKGDPVDNARKSDFVILSVKPQDAPEVLKVLELGRKTILVSIMAGVAVKKISALSGHDKIVRVMPNLSLTIAGWISSGLSEGEKKKTKRFLDMITENFEVKREDDINKITAISGSGPAYFFLLASAMKEAARKLGLKETDKLVKKTLLAAASAEGDYSELVKKVASKGGTTEAALKILKIEKTVEKAIKAAYKRAQELSR